MQWCLPLQCLHYAFCGFGYASCGFGYASCGFWLSIVIFGYALCDSMLYDTWIHTWHNMEPHMT